MRRRRRLQHPGRESRHRRLSPEALLHVLSRYDAKGSLRLVRLWRAWEEVVGAEVASLARPVGHKDQTLLLHTEDAIAAQQLSYFAPEIIARVNAFFGEEVFDKVRFELLNGRVPLGAHKTPEPAKAPAPPQMPSDLGGLVGTMDPESPVGRCYLAYVRRFARRAAQGAAEDANICPKRASRRTK